MWYSLKGCRRCGGDLYEDWDPPYGRYVSCLQCGFRPSDGEEMVAAGVDGTSRTAVGQLAGANR